MEYSDLENYFCRFQKITVNARNMHASNKRNSISSSLRGDPSSMVATSDEKRVVYSYISLITIAALTAPAIRRNDDVTSVVHVGYTSNVSSIGRR